MQVLIALDDSRSMADTGCSGFACEAVVVLARALTRLEVGSLGIVSFGGAGAVQQLHPLDRPFTDADGPHVLSRLRFDQVRAHDAAHGDLGNIPATLMPASLAMCLTSDGRPRHDIFISLM